jgi:hypothetical protein
MQNAATSARYAGNVILFNIEQGVLEWSMPRELVRIRIENFQGFGCSECDWKFDSSSPLAGDTLDEMKRNYRARLDKDFAAHTCVKRRSPSFD